MEERRSEQNASFCYYTINHHEVVYTTQNRFRDLAGDTSDDEKNQDESNREDNIDQSSPLIHKLYHDYIENYGDSGGGPIVYPVWHGQGLVAEECRLELARLLKSIDAVAQDLQANGIVHDIIDPSLHSRHLDQQELEQLMDERGGMKRLRQMRGEQSNNEQELEEEEENPFDFEEYIQTELQKQAVRDQVANQNNMVHFRGSFQWVPTVVKCSYDSESKTGRAHFLGDIAGLPPRHFCESLYRNIEQVFSSMLPLLAQIPLSNMDSYWLHPAYNDEGSKEWVQKHLNAHTPHASLQDGNLQVVVKAQNYTLPPHSTHTGRWHTEGFTENIVAACVYYVEVSSESIGGCLSFRPGQCADASYFEGRYAGTMRENRWGFYPDQDSSEMRENSNDWTN